MESSSFIVSPILSFGEVVDQPVAWLRKFGFVIRLPSSPYAREGNPPPAITNTHKAAANIIKVRRIDAI